jgi:hypothetical protein
MCSPKLVGIDGSSCTLLPNQFAVLLYITATLSFERQALPGGNGPLRQLAAWLFTMVYLVAPRVRHPLYILVGLPNLAVVYACGCIQQ